MMTLLTRDGQSKLVEACTYPLTGVACVSRIYTDVAVFLIDREAAGEDAEPTVLVRETHGMTFDELQALVPVPLRRA
jgi:3-oxoadipate CoA-transferase beta subunit